MASKKVNFINTKELGEKLKRRREDLSLSLRDIADATQISASTLSRIENGTGKPSAENIAKLTAWLNIPFERIMNVNNSDATPVVYFPNEKTPEIVEAHLRADPNLTPEIAASLAELFRVAYNQFVKSKE
ncbi:MAG: helix-turn-helix domain-containing protein [Pyrinomonadaceae bacterium]|jgi:transcriptional regulator with XRE-family HTH domain